MAYPWCPPYQTTPSLQTLQRGWGAAWDALQVVGTWEPHKVALHINVLEMKAVLLALRRKAFGSICFQDGSFNAPLLSLKTVNFVHLSVFPPSFFSSLSQKIHSGGNKCIAEDKVGLRGDLEVEGSFKFTSCFKRSWFLVKAW